MHHSVGRDAAEDPDAILDKAMNHAVIDSNTECSIGVTELSWAIPKACLRKSGEKSLIGKT